MTRFAPGSFLTSTLLATTIVASPAFAQDQDWTWEITLAATATNFQGTSETGGVKGDIGRDFSELVDELEIGGMANVVGDFGRFSLMADAWQTKAAAEDEDTPSTVDLEQTIVEVDGGWDLGKGFDLIVGARSYSVDSDLFAVTHEGVFTARGDERWVDPIVGVRFFAPAGDRWNVSGRAAIGGFGVGSDLTWDVAGFFAYEVGETAGLGLGYRVLAVDFEDGEGQERFRHDVVLTALVGGVQFHF